MRCLVYILAAFVAGLFVGARYEGRETSDERRVTVYDTVRCYQPVVRDSVVVRYETRRLAVSDGRADGSSSGAEVGNLLPMTEVGNLRSMGDSVSVEIPITQKHYRDSTYEAWVSGFAQQIDSIRVYSRRETIIFRDYTPPTRWHLGLTAGYAYTPRGFQPYIGIGISYSIISWK